MRPRILIADDHQMFADSLHALLGQTYDVVGLVKDGRELIDKAIQHKPDVILTDLAMPHITGLDAIPAIRQKGVKSKFIVMTMHEDLSLAVLVFRAGASAFLLKTARGDELKKAMETVLRGGYYLSRECSSDLLTVMAEAARHPASEKGAQLTKRQREVLKLVAEGRTMKEIASELNISTRTAESYKYHLMNVLGIRTTAELVQHAIKIGLITVSPFNVAS